MGTGTKTVPGKTTGGYLIFIASEARGPSKLRLVLSTYFGNFDNCRVHRTESFAEIDLLVQIFYDIPQIGCKEDILRTSDIDKTTFHNQTNLENEHMHVMNNLELVSGV